MENSARKNRKYPHIPGQAGKERPPKNTKNSQKREINGSKNTKKTEKNIGL